MKKIQGAQFVSLGVLGASTITAGLILAGNGIASAESTSVVTAIKVLESCSMSLDDNNSTAHTATMVGGTVNTSIGLTAVDITCNDTNGYSVYAMGVAADGVTSNTNLVGATHNQTIPTGTNMSSNTGGRYGQHNLLRTYDP